MPYFDLRFELNDPRLRNDIVAGMQLFDNCLVCRQLATGFAEWHRQISQSWTKPAAKQICDVWHCVFFFETTTYVFNLIEQMLSSSTIEATSYAPFTDLPYNP